MDCEEMGKMLHAMQGRVTSLESAMKTEIERREMAESARDALADTLNWERCRRAELERLRK